MPGSGGQGAPISFRLMYWVGENEPGPCGDGPQRGRDRGNAIELENGVICVTR